MLKQDFMVGPFEIRPVSGGFFNIHYGNQIMAHRIDAGDGETRQAVIEGLRDCLARITCELSEQHNESHRIDLVNSDGEILGYFFSEYAALPGMTPGLIDDRCPFWLRTTNRLRSMPVDLKDYPIIVQQYQVPARAWIAKLLSKAVLMENPDLWQAPTSWEIRHIVGEGSFTGISGAKAAALVGISPANFRKYTATDSAKNRQSISFSAWHLLLQRLSITKTLTAYQN